MNRYEELLAKADSLGLIIKEKPLVSADGRISGNKIAIRKDIPTIKEKACVLAEELGHHHTTVGNIIDIDCSQARKQERQARLWAYDNRIGLNGLIRAYEARCQNQHEIADYLDVTESFLQEAIDSYRDRYGVDTFVDNYYIRFLPNLQIAKLF